MCGNGAVCGGRYDLTKSFCAYVACGKYAGKICFCAFIRNDIALLIKRKLLFEDRGNRGASYAYKQAVKLNIGADTVFHVFNADPRKLFIKQKLTDLAVPQKFYVFRFHKRIVINFCGAQSIAPVDKINFFAYAGEKECILHCGVAAADNGNGLSAVKHTVARGTVSDASAYEGFFV